MGYSRALSASREYDAFGNIIPHSASGTWPGRCGYQGQAWIEIASADGSQQFLLSPTRIYNPPDGRFISRDPLNIGSSGRVGVISLDPYEYVRSNPPVALDPNGQATVDIAPSWQHHPFSRVPGGPFRLPGWTDFNLHSFWECVPCKTDGCYGPIVHVKLRTAIYIATAWLGQPDISGNALTLRRIYGHEQRHVKDMQDYTRGTIIPALDKFEETNHCK